MARVHPGVYVAKSRLRDRLSEAEIEQAVRRSWRDVVANELKGEVIVTDRSALSGGPTPDGHLYVVTPGRKRRRVVELPGLTISTRDGAPADHADAEMLPGLWLASTGRALLENTMPSRTSQRGVQRRTLTSAEIGDWVERIASGPRPVENLRHARTEIDRLEATGDYAGSDPQMASRLIGAALGTRHVVTDSKRLASRVAGRPYDAERVELLEEFADQLSRSSPVVRATPDPTRTKLVPFYEAYYSNFIEGTEFTIDEAYEVVFTGHDLDRPDDAHDVRGTWQITSDLDEMSNVAGTVAEFIEMLMRRHSLVMASRTDKRPGAFKDRSNRVGAIEFVTPHQVDETLRLGWHHLDHLSDPFHRACYTMFLITEVHPFLDGNGRVARLFMNAELVAANQPRIIIPTVYRNNYLGALSGLSNGNNPDALPRVLGFAQRWVAAGEWQDRDHADRYLEASQANATPTAEQHGEARLRIPDPAALAEVEDENLGGISRRVAARTRNAQPICGTRTPSMNGPCVLDPGHPGHHSSTGRRRKRT